jgi:hypothetical protein
VTRRKKHGYERYSDECGALRAVQGAVADMRHEAGLIPPDGNGWEGMDLDTPVDTITLDELVAAYDYAIGQAETPALKAVRRYVDDLYEPSTVAGMVRKAKSMRAKLRREQKEKQAA